jgi:hypothetical protein
MSSSFLYPLDITPQPDELSCGAASLHSLYRYHGLELPFERIRAEIPRLPGGGTLAVFLGCHALRLGFKATIYTCDLQTFDPTWFATPDIDLSAKLEEQLDTKKDAFLRIPTAAYHEYLTLGGEIRMEDMNLELLVDLLQQFGPVIAGLSATWLYRCARERQEDMVEDDIAGHPTGHFLIIRGVDAESRHARVADPYLHHPYPGSHDYEVSVHRLISAILLSILTFDAKLLVLQPADAAV